MQTETTSEDFTKATDALLLQKLPEEMRAEWSEISKLIAEIKSRGERIQDYPELLDRMNDIMLTDEFILASVAATNEVMSAQGVDLQWWLDTAPKPSSGE